MGEGHLRDIHFGQFFVIFAKFRPKYNHNKGPEESSSPVKVPLNFPEKHVELYGSEKD